MNKGDFIEKMAADAKITRAAASRALNSFIKSLVSTLQQGERATLAGFGTFYRVTRKARKARNPRTGATVQVGAKNVARFKPADKLIKDLNV